ncbi:MAG: hypothetical protein ACI9GW_002377 [Halieaceae bacterium]|jgi:hypothetical protein
MRAAMLMPKHRTTSEIGCERTTPHKCQDCHHKHSAGMVGKCYGPVEAQEVENGDYPFSCSSFST